MSLIHTGCICKHLKGDCTISQNLAVVIVSASVVGVILLYVQFITEHMHLAV